VPRSVQERACPSAPCALGDVLQWPRPAAQACRCGLPSLRNLHAHDFVRAERCCARAVYDRRSVIVHRDLKPANLLFGGIPHETGNRDMAACHGIIKIADFGLSRTLVVNAKSPINSVDVVVAAGSFGKVRHPRGQTERCCRCGTSRGSDGLWDGAVALRAAARRTCPSSAGPGTWCSQRNAIRRPLHSCLGVDGLLTGAMPLPLARVAAADGFVLSVCDLQGSLSKSKTRPPSERFDLTGALLFNAPTMGLDAHCSQRVLCIVCRLHRFAALLAVATMPPNCMSITAAAGAGDAPRKRTSEKGKGCRCFERTPRAVE
jgi:serine/threonine protein kinase